MTIIKVKTAERYERRVLVKESDADLVGDYVSSIICWLQDNTRRGDKGKRKDIERYGDELVKRGLLSREDADLFYRGNY